MSYSFVQQLRSYNRPVPGVEQEPSGLPDVDILRDLVERYKQDVRFMGAAVQEGLEEVMAASSSQMHALAAAVRELMDHAAAQDVEIKQMKLEAQEAQQMAEERLIQQEEEHARVLAEMERTHQEALQQLREKHEAEIQGREIEPSKVSAEAAQQGVPEADVPPPMKEEASAEHLEQATPPKPSSEPVISPFQQLSLQDCLPPVSLPGEGQQPDLKPLGSVDVVFTSAPDNDCQTGSAADSPHTPTRPEEYVPLDAEEASAA